MSLEKMERPTGLARPTTRTASSPSVESSVVRSPRPWSGYYWSKGINMDIDAWDDVTDAHRYSYCRTCFLSTEPGNDWMRIDVCVRSHLRAV